MPIVFPILMPITSGEHRFAAVTEFGLVQASWNPALAVGQLVPQVGFHSKSLRLRVREKRVTLQTPRKSRGISSFFRILTHRRSATSLA
jgi:hypothetical protein